jgi:hypothetical protein
VGGVLGSISWRGPFFGVSALMALALVVTTLLLPSTPRAEKATTLVDPFRALAHRGLLGVAITALLYNFGLFALVGFAPFPLDMNAHQIGLIFFGWGLALAFTAVVVAPRLQRRFGTVSTLLVNLLAMTATLVVMALGTDNKSVLASCVVVAGLFIGINNTLVTETVMKAAPLNVAWPRRPTASCGSPGRRWRRGWPVCWASGSTCTCRSGSARQRCCWAPASWPPPARIWAASTPTTKTCCRQPRMTRSPSPSAPTAKPRAFAFSRRNAMVTRGHPLGRPLVAQRRCRRAVRRDRVVLAA